MQPLNSKCKRNCHKLPEISSLHTKKWWLYCYQGPLKWNIKYVKKKIEQNFQASESHKQKEKARQDKKFKKGDPRTYS